MIALAAAIQFLLVSPAFVRRPFTSAEMGRSTAYYPLVGALLGAMLAGADALLEPIFPIELRSAVLLVLWIGLTGGLHFDGFLDAADGLLGGETPERRLLIMRDQHIGAYGVAAAGLILLTMFAGLNALSAPRWAALVMAPVLGRCAMGVCIAVLPYGRRDGLGRDIKDGTRPIHAAAAVISTLGMAAFVVWRTQHLAAAASVLVAMLIGIAAARFVLGRIPGMTGDTYGAINMLIELGVVLTFVAAP